jgi:hypothetical protein
MSSKNEKLLEEMSMHRANYDSNSAKNLFFKKKHKMQMAQYVSEQYDINSLLENTAYLIPNTPKVFIDYPLFKQFANESNYQYFVDYVLKLFDYAINTYGHYVVHINLDTLTVSAAERYKRVIILFNTECISRQTQFIRYLKEWYVYNPPHVIIMIRNIMQMVIDSRVMEKAIIVSKKDSYRELMKLNTYIEYMNSGNSSSSSAGSTGSMFNPPNVPN